MSLDQHLWERLEAHGLTCEHLELLLSLLELERNGSMTWHVVRGQLDQHELHVKVPARTREIRRVAHELLPMLGPRPRRP